MSKLKSLPDEIIVQILQTNPININLCKTNKKYSSECKQYCFKMIKDNYPRLKIKKNAGNNIVICELYNFILNGAKYKTYWGNEVTEKIHDDSDNNYVFTEAYNAGLFNIVKFLCEQGNISNVTVKDTIQGAAGIPNYRIIKYLMEHFKIKGIVDDILSIGIEDNNINIVKLALHYGAKTKQKHITSALKYSKGMVNMLMAYT